MFTNHKGIVLISVLLIVLILSAISVSIGKYYFLSFTREGFVDFQNNALQYSRNLETFALNELGKEFKFSKQSFPKNHVLLSQPMAIELEHGTLNATLADATNCFNLNSLFDYRNEQYTTNLEAIAGFQKLLGFLEFDNNDIDSLTDQILDWIDADDQPRSNGLEDYYYIGPMNTAKQFTSKRLFYHLSELKNLPASTAIAWPAFRQHFCVRPSTRGNYAINLNTLESDDVLLLASIYPGLSLDDAESIINTIPEEGFASTSQLASAFPNFDFSTTHLPISFTTEWFYLDAVITFEKYSATSRTLINMNNNKAYIVSRSYNGI